MKVLLSLLSLLSVVTKHHVINDPGFNLTRITEDALKAFLEQLWTRSVLSRSTFCVTMQTNSIYNSVHYKKLELNIIAGAKIFTTANMLAASRSTRSNKDRTTNLR